MPKFTVSDQLFTIRYRLRRLFSDTSIVFAAGAALVLLLGAMTVGALAYLHDTPPAPHIQRQSADQAPPRASAMPATEPIMPPVAAPPPAAPRSWQSTPPVPAAPVPTPSVPATPPPAAPAPPPKLPSKPSVGQPADTYVPPTP